MPKLLPHQQKIVDTLENKKGLWLRPRVGKTCTSIRLACKHSKSCLVIIPKHIKEQWQEEIDKWNNTDCQFTLITKERFRIDSIASIKKRGRGQTIIFSDKIPPHDTLLIDEVHRQASNYANKFFKTVDHYIQHHKVKNVWLLSGTPWNKNPWSVYSYGRLLGKDWKWKDWQGYFFTPVRMGMRIIFTPDESKFPALVKLLFDLGVTVKLEDITGTVKDCTEVEYFDLNTEQKKMIKEVIDTTPIARYGKYHQIESGTLKSDGYTSDVSIDCDKDKRILELAEDNDKLIIVCRYLHQIYKYSDMLSKALKKVLVIKGTMQESLEYVRNRAEELDKVVVIIQADKSDGYSLKSFSTMVFASMSYSFISYDQMKNRIKAMDKKEPCHYIHLLARGKTVDKGVYDSVMKGQDFSEQLFNNK